MKVEVHFMLALSQKRRGFPRVALRVLGPRSAAHVGELQVPMTLIVDDALLRQKLPRVRIELPATELARAIAGTPFLTATPTT